MEDLRKNCDFSGWATRTDVKCSDGRTIKRGAFKEDNGKIVPLLWNHDHDNNFNVLGHALLEDRGNGVYAYCKFNDTESGQNAKKLVGHRDVCALSIFANKLKQNGKDVVHGVIRELSLVLAGANPKAYIENVMAHGEEDGECATIYTVDEDQDEILLHSITDTSDDDWDPFEENEEDDPAPAPDPEPVKHAETTEPIKEEHKMANPETNPEGGKTVKEVFDSMTEEQKTVVYAMIGQALEDAGKGGNEMKHNAFDDEYEDEYETDGFLCHADRVGILEMAKSKSCGSLKDAMEAYFQEYNNDDSCTLQHGFEQIDELFPEFYDLMQGAPEAIPENDEWVTTIMGKASKSPHGRIRTRQADVSAITAGGYRTKGSKKKDTGLIRLVKRSTDSQTIYIKDTMNRDDKLDITDFDVVGYQYGLMKNALEEEIATDILIGDGRADDDEQKVEENHVRPIYTDDELYTIHVDLDIEGTKTELQGSNTGANFGESFILAESVIRALLFARENYKGKGNPDFFCTPHLLNTMLLARDMNGRRIYTTKTELASALNVNSIVTIEKLAGKTRTVDDEEPKTKELLGLMLNMADYTIGTVKGGQITSFNQFDIDFNQEKYLIETRLCGALTRVKSAIALEKDITGAMAAKRTVKKEAPAENA